MKITFEHIEKAIQSASARDQQRLLRNLPKLLHIPADRQAWLKASERSFRFWNNPEDACYDRM